jgi:hypothetical protein
MSRSKAVLIDLSKHPVAQAKWAIRAFKETLAYFILSNS